MHRTRFEKLKDDLIGEAVLLILKDNGPINFKSLAIKLKKMASTERDTERCSALSAAVAEVDQKVNSSESMHPDVTKKSYISNMQRLMVNPTQH